MNPFFFRIEYLLVLAVTAIPSPFIVIDMIISFIVCHMFCSIGWVFSLAVFVCVLCFVPPASRKSIYTFVTNSNEMKTKHKTVISRIISLVQSVTHNEQSARENSFQHQQYRNINNTLGCIVGYGIMKNEFEIDFIVSKTWKTSICTKKYSIFERKFLVKPIDGFLVYIFQLIQPWK